MSQGCFTFEEEVEAGTTRAGFVTAASFPI